MEQSAALKYGQETFANYLILRAQGSTPEKASALCGLKLGGPTPLPPSMPTILRAHFARYTFVPAPNGMPIHIVAQAGVSKARIMAERLKVALFVMGKNKGLDTNPNVLAEAGATLLLFADADAALYKRRSRWIRLTNEKKQAA